MNNKPEIAIIESNTLTCLGLKSILEEIIPMATIRTFHSFSELIDDTPDMYAHYFISAQIYVEHNAFFLPLSAFERTRCDYFPENEKQLYWPVTVRNSSCRACRYSIFMSQKKSLWKVCWNFINMHTTTVILWKTCPRLPCRKHIRKSYLPAK